ncbi:MAG: CarD family transcriptional regulator [Terriglobales bacterium]
MTNGQVFHIGDKVVYPNHGVGIVEQIASLTVGSQVEKFYVLSIAASNLKVRVPVHNVDSVGIRPVVRNGEIQKIVEYLSSGECINAGDWKDRFRENSERMRTGALSDVAMVLKSLLLLAQGKSLSFREKKMLERARYLLVSEIAISRNCHERLIEEALTKALTKCNLRLPEITELAS